MSAQPELPKPEYSTRSLGRPDIAYFSHAQIREYGDARAAHARKAAFEEAAKVCETQIDPTRPATTSGFAYWHAKQIKELLK